MKGARQDEILDIIKTVSVETQEQLLEQLRLRGYSATQATISRDIKELHLVKEQTGNGSYRYAVSEQKVAAAADSRLRNIFKAGVISVDVAQNIVVLRTMPGLASGACSALDSMDIPEMVGSLAGDDTAILIMRENSAAHRLTSDIHQLLK